MKSTAISIALLLVVTCTLILPGIAAAQGSTISTVTLDSKTFITVKETGTGDVISLYQVRGDKVYLVDVLFNSTSRDVNLPKRYTHHIELENR